MTTTRIKFDFAFPRNLVNRTEPFQKTVVLLCFNCLLWLAGYCGCVVDNVFWTLFFWKFWAQTTFIWQQLTTVFSAVFHQSISFIWAPVPAVQFPKVGPTPWPLPISHRQTKIILLQDMAKEKSCRKFGETDERCLPREHLPHVKYLKRCFLQDSGNRDWERRTLRVSCPPVLCEVCRLAPEPLEHARSCI